MPSSNHDLLAELEAAAGKWVLEKNKYTLESLRDARAAVLKQMTPVDSMGIDHRRLERRVAAMVTWLEANQPDVFLRGLWDAVEKAGGGSPDETTALPHLDTCSLKYGGSRCTCGLTPVEPSVGRGSTCFADDIAPGGWACPPEKVSEDDGVFEHSIKCSASSRTPIDGPGCSCRHEKAGARCDWGCHVHWSGWPASHHPNCTVNGSRDV